MTTKQQELEQLREAAVAYATELLDGFSETQRPASLAGWLIELENEYHSSRLERRGMDRRLVKRIVQHLIDVAKFEKDNEPPMYEPTEDDVIKWERGEADDLPLFYYVRRRGAPLDPMVVDRIA